MSASKKMALEFAPRTASAHPDVRRAWDMNRSAVVVSFTRTGETDPRIAVMAKGREQEVLDRCHREFGDPTKTLHIPDRLPEPA